MKYINFSREIGDENEPVNLVLEGDLESLKEFHSRMGRVLENEIDKLPTVKFGDGIPGISLNGSPIKFCMRKTIKISKRTSWIQKDVIIAVGIIILCVVLVVFTLLTTGKKSIE